MTTLPYSFKPTKHFKRRYNSLTKRNKILKKRVSKTLKIMRTDPFYRGLNTHKVDSLDFGIHYASTVTGDIRIIWNFNKDNNIIILLLTIGGHTGKRKVYKKNS